MEIRLEEFKNTNISINTEDIRVNTLNEKGGNVRVLVDGRWGFSSFNDLSLIDDFSKRAIKQAKLSGMGKTTLAPVSSVVDFVKAKASVDAGGISKKDKVELLKSYNEIVLNYNKKKIKSSELGYRENFKKKYFANSEGTYIEEEQPVLYINIMPVAAKEGISQLTRVSEGSCGDFSICYNLEEKIEKACSTAIKHLDAKKIKSGTYTVICDPDFGGTFVHEAFGHNCEGDHCTSKTAQEELRLGRKLAAEILSVYDTGLKENHIGFMKYDDEGVRTEKTYLIKEGILTGRLHSRETAAILGELPTGSARAINYKYPPICRMRITCIENGKSTFSHMVKSTELGVYVSGSIQGKRSGDIYAISPYYSYMIRDGEIAEPVRGVQISGNIFENLKNIDTIGNDFKIKPGGCGKRDQYPLPVSSGSPHIRIQNVAIGGTS